MVHPVKPHIPALSTVRDAARAGAHKCCRLKGSLQRSSDPLINRFVPASL